MTRMARPCCSGTPPSRRRAVTTSVRPSRSSPARNQRSTPTSRRWSRPMWPTIRRARPDGVNVTTVKPERTFWDKVVILHGLRQWHDRRNELRTVDLRVSRHYYDVHQLMQAASASRMAGRPCARDRLRTACAAVLRQRGPGARYRDTRHIHTDTQRGDAGCTRQGLCGHVRDDLRRDSGTRCGTRQRGRFEQIVNDATTAASLADGGVHDRLLQRPREWPSCPCRAGDLAHGLGGLV